MKKLVVYKRDGENQIIICFDEEGKKFTSHEMLEAQREVSVLLQEVNRYKPKIAINRLIEEYGSYAIFEAFREIQNR